MRRIRRRRRIQRRRRRSRAIASFSSPDPRRAPPSGVDDLELGGPLAQAYPADPSGVVRDGTRFNLVIVVRIGSDGLSEETRERSADGVVAYSCVCTHQACPVNMWSRELPAVRLFMPRFGYTTRRTAPRCWPDRRRGLGRVAAEIRKRPADRRRGIYQPRRRGNELMWSASADLTSPTGPRGL